MALSIASRLSMALDPVRLAMAAGVEPDAWQARLLRSTSRQILMLASRQSGKSSTAALLALDEVIHRAPALVLILAPALRQSQEGFRKIKSLLAALGDIAPPLAQESALGLEFTTGSRIVCLPGKDQNIRGFSAVSLLVVDEAARVVDPLYFAVRPMLAVSGGRIVLLSTPWGRRGFFYHEATAGATDWDVARVTALECPRISREWLEQERARIGDFWFAQEYMLEFRETDDQLFSHESVMAALSDDVAPLFGEAA